MKQNTKMRERWQGFINTIIRFPLTIILLLAACLTNFTAILQQEEDSLVRLVITFTLGAFIYAVFEILYERFYDKPVLRSVFMIITVALSFLYYALVNNSKWNVIVSIRTLVILFVLLIAFLWIPVIKSRISFQQNFLVAFKGFFVSFFLAGVLFLGVTLIISTTNMLIISVDEKAYFHAANIIFVLFAPIYFLSMIPIYSNKDNPKELITNDDLYEIKENQADNYIVPPGRFLETLITFIIIPVTAVFTIILLLYLLMNITGEFWTDNLFEPLLVSYSITVIIVYLLAGSVNHAFTKVFRLIFPKVLVPIVLFQTISSIIKIEETGITYGRYYVIMFGIFATISGIIFSILPTSKNKLIAPILIILSVISILPPVDAFSVSRANQISRLEHTLKKNNMLNNGSLTPSSTVSKRDQEIIVTSVRYLERFDYVKDIQWLSNYSKNNNFKNTFGFSEFDIDRNDFHYIQVNRDAVTPIPVMGYDYLTHTNINSQSADIVVSRYDKEGTSFTLRCVEGEDNNQDILLEAEGKELIRLQMKDIFLKFMNYSENTMVETQEVTFVADNASATLTVIADMISINEQGDESYHYFEGYILVKIK